MPLNGTVALPCLKPLQGALRHLAVPSGIFVRLRACQGSLSLDVLRGLPSFLPFVVCLFVVLGSELMDLSLQGSSTT